MILIFAAIIIENITCSIIEFINITVGWINIDLVASASPILTKNNFL